MSIRADFGRALEIATPGQPMYHDAHYLAATLDIADPVAMRRFLPPGVRLAKDRRADLFLAWFPHNPFTPGYLEAGLFVHVKAGLGHGGIHCPWMIVDDDIALILGREATGYPKKLGNIDWERTGDTVTARAERRGTPLVEMTARLCGHSKAPLKFLGRPHRNMVSLLGIPLPMVVAFTPDERPLEVREADVDVKIGGSQSDPLDRMGLGEVVHARLHRVDIYAPSLPPIPIRPTSPLFLFRHLDTRVL